MAARWAIARSAIRGRAMLALACRVTLSCRGWRTKPPGLPVTTETCSESSNGHKRAPRSTDFRHPSASIQVSSVSWQARAALAQHDLRPQHGPTAAVASSARWLSCKRKRCADAHGTMEPAAFRTAGVTLRRSTIRDMFFSALWYFRTSGCAEQPRSSAMACSSAERALGEWRS